jgi:multiple sugar transport system substrate-binding protein
LVSEESLMPNTHQRGLSQPGPTRRTLLKAAGGLAFAAAGTTATTACGGSSGGGSGSTFKIAYFGDQAGADKLRARLQEPVRAIDKSVTLQVNATNGTDWNDFFAKILTQIAAGQTPDIAAVPTEGLQLFARKQLAIPLDDYVKKDAEALKPYFADVHPSLVEAMMYEGHLYELPLDFNAGNMFYSTKLFKNAGLAPPTADWTIDDFHTMAVKLAKSGAKAQDFPFNWVVRLWGSWTSFMYANGGNLLEEGKYDGGDWLWNAFYQGDPAAQGRGGGWKWGQPTANTTPVVEALDYMIQLRREALSPSPDVGGGDTLQGLFASDRIAMAIGGGFWAGGLSNAGMKPGSFDVQLFPKWKAQRHLFGTGGYGIFKASKQKDLAWEVIKLLIQPASFELLFPGNTTTPVRRSLMTAQRYGKTGPQHWQVFYDTLTKHPNTAPIPAPPYYNALANSLNQHTTQAIASGNAKAALDAMQRDLESAAAGQK